MIIGEWGVDDTLSWYGVIMARKKGTRRKDPLESEFYIDILVRSGKKW